MDEKEFIEAARDVLLWEDAEFLPGYAVEFNEPVRLTISQPGIYLISVGGSEEAIVQLNERTVLNAYSVYSGQRVTGTTQLELREKDVLEMTAGDKAAVMLLTPK